MENKLGKPRGSEKERVPKWNREQFLARQTKMEKRHLDRQDSSEGTYRKYVGGVRKKIAICNTNSGLMLALHSLRPTTKIVTELKIEKMSLHVLVVATYIIFNKTIFML